MFGSATGLAFFAALIYIPPSKLMIVSNTTPILLVFLYFFLFKEKIYLNEFLASFTAFAGIIFMSFAKKNEGGEYHHQYIGIILSMVSATGWSVAIIAI